MDMSFRLFENNAMDNPFTIENLSNPFDLVVFRRLNLRILKYFSYVIFTPEVIESVQ